MMNARLATSDLRHAAPQRSASLRLCVKKTALLLSPLRPLGGRHSLLLSPLRPLRGRNKGFTLFELLAVLTVIGIGLAILVGAYGSWGTAHALTGATRVVEAGLQQARTLAVTRHAYVAFSYGSTNRPAVVTSATTGFQSFICTNAVPPVDETALRDLVQNVDNKMFLPSQSTEFGDIANPLILEPATPFQRLSGHVRLSRREKPDSGEHTPSLLIFRPDGSVMIDDGITPSDYPYHTIALHTAQSFPDPESATPAPLVRLLRIDPATGTVTVLGDPR
jgi:prepilin-type N-terminal cleavage/methylation domain-containing protein